ncbi:MAG: hypothetical protein IJT33_05585 [Campylobacter sp.]|nr:hypothetical protein [Campylobacter sp.]MBQ7675913.1 hypothetical protein [Campylobacter sp.]MBQ9876049.1 hypothetical protein [Campylobacter sp.]MBR0071963.1 hypothetical protein [Campylobacter sp.]
MIISQPFVMTLLFCEALVLFFCTIALFYGVKIAFKFDENLLSPKQYKLAQTSYLVSTIVKFALFVKLPLFLFFIWVLDELSSLIPGAMCAVGVIDATEFGAYLLFFKITNLFLLSGWIYLNSQDFKTKTCKFMKLKFRLFIIIFIFIFCEIALEYLHFFGIKTTHIVQCCSEIFKTSHFSVNAFYHKNSFILGAFYGIFTLFAFSAILRKQSLFSALSAIFVFVSIYALIRFFSPYIYELPTHKCPFCMLEKEYNYVGYAIYILIFLGAMPGVYSFISKLLNIKFDDFYFKLSLFANSLLVAILSGFVLVYRFKNGVWL